MYKYNLQHIIWFNLTDDEKVKLLQDFYISSYLINKYKDKAFSQLNTRFKSSFNEMIYEIAIKHLKKKLRDD